LKNKNFIQENQKSFTQTFKYLCCGCEEDQSGIDILVTQYFEIFKGGCFSRLSLISIKWT